MFKDVADRVLLAVVLVEAVVAHRHVRRIDRAGFSIGLVVLVACQQREAGVRIRTPREGRGDVPQVVGVAMIAVVLDLGTSVSKNPGQAVQVLAFLIDGPAEVDRGLAPVKAAGLQDDFAEGLGGGALGDAIDQPARGDLAVQDGRRAAQDLHTFQRVRVGARADLVVGKLAEAVAEIPSDLGVKAAQHDPVIADLGAAKVADLYAGHILDCLRHRLHATVQHFLRAHHRNGLRNLPQRGRRLAARQCFLCHNPVQGSRGGVHRVCPDVDGGQRGRGAVGGLLRVGGRADSQPQQQGIGQLAKCARRRRAAR
ncbi:hypothetical protein D3C87_1363630 [compost metagenome]